MSIEPGEHCGHDCCDEPHNPLHSHFLDPETCNQCERVRNVRIALERKIRGVVYSDSPPITPQPDSDAGARQRIERLEAELADLRAERDDWKREAESHIEVMNKSTNRIGTLQHELADLRASSVVYKVRCETCGGEKGCWCQRASLGDWHRLDVSHTALNVQRYDEPPCPDCVDGWQLVEGVVLVDGPHIPRHYVIPARLIEGEA